MRLALRRLLHSPAYSILAFLTLTIGMAASIAGFTVMNAVLLHPLPYPDSDRIVLIQAPAINTDNLHEWVSRLSTVDHVAPIDLGLANMDTQGGPERVPGMLVSPEFFPLLGLHPTAGRPILPADLRTGAVVEISDRLATRLFGSPDAALGHVLHMVGTGYYNESYQVVGTFAPLGPLPWNRFGADTDFLLPYITPMPRAEGAAILARLKPAVTLAAVRAEADSIARSLAPARPDPHFGYTTDVEILKDFVLQGSSLIIRLLFAAALLVLLITCANVAHMVLARSACRSRETAVRLAIGASRLRLARELLTENLLLAVAASAAGLWLASLAVRLLVTLVPYQVPRLSDARITAGVVAFAATVVLFSSLAFVLAPLLESRDLDLNRALKEASQQVAGSLRQRWLRSLFVIGEIAVACVVLVAAGLLLQSFLAVRPANPGFNPHNKLVLRVGNTTGTDEQSIPLLAALQNRISDLPGVRHVAADTELPMGGISWVPDVRIASRIVYGNHPGQVFFHSVSDNYFSTMDIAVVAGRAFTAADSAQRLPVAMVNQRFAEMYFAGGSPLGQRIEIVRGGHPENLPFTIIGICRDARMFGTVAEPRPEAYIPFALSPYRGFWLAIDTSGGPLRFASDVRSIVHSLAPQAVVTDMQTMDDIVWQSVAEPRFDALLLGILAALAVVLALAGIYAVMSYSVAQRTHEMGVRIAVGARTANVLSLVLGGALRLAVIGIALGTASAFAISGTLRSILFGIAPADPRSYLASAVLLLLLALGAAYLPALRAARTDPLTALRAE